MLSRKLVVGDVIIAKEEAVRVLGDITEGEGYEVYKMSSLGYGMILDDEGGARVISVDRLHMFSLYSQEPYVSIARIEQISTERIFTLEVDVDAEGYRAILAMEKRRQIAEQREEVQKELLSLQERLRLLEEEEKEL